jgi:hypothetical protein
MRGLPGDSENGEIQSCLKSFKPMPLHGWINSGLGGTLRRLLLWLLARTPSVKPEVIKKFVEMSKARGFKTEDLIFPRQN